MIQRVQFNDDQKIEQIATWMQAGNFSWTSEAIQKAIAQQGVVYLYCPEGFLSGQLVLDEAEIYHVYVDERFRRRGIANRLWHHFKQILIQEGVKNCFLEVRKSNTAAQHFYEKQSFKQIGERSRYYQDPVEDAFIYKWESSYE